MALLIVEQPISKRGRKGDEEMEAIEIGEGEEERVNKGRREGGSLFGPLHSINLGTEVWYIQHADSGVHLQVVHSSHHVLERAMAQHRLQTLEQIQHAANLQRNNGGI